MLKTGTVVQITLTQHSPRLYNIRLDNEYRTYSPQGRIYLNNVEVDILEVCKILLSNNRIDAEFEVNEDSYVEVIDINLKANC